MRILDEKLFDATEKGDINLVKQLLKQGANPRCKSEKYNNTLLHEAIYNGHEYLAKFLLEEFPDLVDKHNDKGNTPLILAVQKRHAGIVELLLRKELLQKTRADVNAKNKNGYTALSCALSNKNLPINMSIIKMLLKNGADLQTMDNYGRTLLHEAAEFGDVKTMEVLWYVGASINAKDDFGRTPLHLAAQAGKFDTIKFLAAHGANMEALDDKKRNFLHLLAREGHSEVFGKSLIFSTEYPRGLFSMENIIFNKDAEGNDPIKIAFYHCKNFKSTNKHSDIKTKILDQSLHCLFIRNINVLKKYHAIDSYVGLHTDPEGNTLLHKVFQVAISPIVLINEESFNEILNFLQTIKIDVNAKNNEGDSPIFNALYIHNEPMAISAIRFLLKVGADINIKNAASLLPLHQACKVNHLPLEIFKSLIERTREIDFKDNLGKTPLDYLLEHKRFHPFILHYLIEKGMKLTNAQVEKAVEVICDLEEIINFSKENEFQKLKKHLENYNIKPKNKLKTITEIPLDLSFKGHLQRVNIKNKNDSERIAETITDEKITDTVLNCGIPHSRTSFFRDINNNNNSSYVKDSKREIEPDDNQFHDSTEKVQEALDSELELAKKLSLQPFKF